MQVEQEIANLVNAIKAGIITESTKSEFVRLEAEPARLQQAVHVPFKNGSAKQLLQDLKGRFRNIVGNLASLASRNIEKTRGALKDLLGSPITLHPCSDGGKRYLTAEICGD